MYLTPNFGNLHPFPTKKNKMTFFTFLIDRTEKRCIMAIPHYASYRPKGNKHFMKGDILEEIMRAKELLPKKQRALCNYLILNCEKAGVMTVAELAESAGVGTTTVMRFVQIMGYDSFSAFKRDLINAMLMKNAAPYQTLKQSFVANSQTESSDTFRSVAADGVRVLENLCSPANVEQFERAVQLLLKAKSIYTLGMRSSKVLALYFEYLVDRFYPHVRQLSDQGEFLYDRVFGHMTPDDVLLAFSVYPCTLKTIKVGELCHQRNIPLILITNTGINPLAKIADVVIDTNTVNHSSGDTAIFAVVEALGAELGRRTAPESSQRIEYIERELVDEDLFVWET